MAIRNLLVITALAAIVSGCASTATQKAPCNRSAAYGTAPVGDCTPRPVNSTTWRV